MTPFDLLTDIAHLRRDTQSIDGAIAPLLDRIAFLIAASTDEPADSYAMACRIAAAEYVALGSASTH